MVAGLETLQDFTFVGKYSHFLDEIQRRETWDEAQGRVHDMHRDFFGERTYLRDDDQTIDNDAFDKLTGIIDDVEIAAKQREVVGSQRALQFAGPPVRNHHGRLYNCVSSYADRPRFFAELVYLLLCGAGTGFSVQRRHVDNLPTLKDMATYAKNSVTYTIPDTIEGWGDAFGILMASYFMTEFKTHDAKVFDFSASLDDANGTAACGRHFGLKVTFDYSEIRKEGAPLHGGFKDRTIGHAPGPMPLRRSLEKIRNLLDGILSQTNSDPSRSSRRDNSKRGDQVYGKKYKAKYLASFWVDGEDGAYSRIEWRTYIMRPIHVYDICMHSSDAVLSGGVRRSATICLFDRTDDEMLHAKTGAWKETNPQRARSNNSVVLMRAHTTYEEFKALLAKVKDCGEPGFVWVDHLDMLVNPCVEIGQYAYIEHEGTRYSGWQFCNLSTINGAKVKTTEDFYRSCKHAAHAGVLQAAYTSFPYLKDPSMPINATELITKRESLLGVSITGMHDNPKLFFNSKVLEKGARICREHANELADLLGIARPARITCIKPSGNSSAALGSASGIHAHHAEVYFRTVQANRQEAPLQHIQSLNPLMVEKSVWNPNGVDMVVRFPCEIKRDHTVSTRRDVSAIRQLELVKLVQKHWVEPGKDESLCAMPWLTHNVSNTIHVKDDEWDQVGHMIYDNRESYCGISILGSAGELDYPQAPFVEIWDDKRIVDTWGAGTMFASGLIVDAMHAFQGDLWKACEAALGVTEITKPRIDALTNLHKQAINVKKDEVERYFMQIDWVRRAKKFAFNYFNGDQASYVREMTYCLKRIHYLKLWKDIHREWQDVDFTLMQNDDASQIDLAAELACAGGACEV